MYEVAKVDLEDINQSMELFAQTNEFDPIDLTADETTPAENHGDNSVMPQKVIQSTSPQSPLPDALISLDLPLLCPCVDAGETARLVRTSDHPKVCLKAAGDAIFGVYQYWVHQHTVNNLDGGIDEDGK